MRQERLALGEPFPLRSANFSPWCEIFLLLAALKNGQSAPHVTHLPPAPPFPLRNRSRARSFGRIAIGQEDRHISISFGKASPSALMLGGSRTRLTVIPGGSP